MFPKPNALARAARDPLQRSLFLDPAEPPGQPARPAVQQAKRHVYALVDQRTHEMLLPVYVTRKEGNDAKVWHPDADYLKVERCRLVMCRR